MFRVLEKCVTQKRLPGFPGSKVLSIRNLQNPKSLILVHQTSPKFVHMLWGTTLRSPKSFSSIAGAEVP